MITTAMIGLEDVGTVSCVLAQSWKTAYRGLIDDDYLDTLPDSHWVDYLTSLFNEDGCFRDGNFCMAIWRDQSLSGAAVVLNTDKADGAYIISFYMLPECIRQGYGRQLYLAVEAEIVARGCTKCSLDVLTSNSAARAFYKALSFEDTGDISPVALGGNTYTVTIMEKKLPCSDV